MRIIHIYKKLQLRITPLHCPGESGDWQRKVSQRLHLALERQLTEDISAHLLLTQLPQQRSLSSHSDLSCLAAVARSSTTGQQPLHAQERRLPVPRLAQHLSDKAHLGNSEREC